jgi:hypothetical protein
MGTWGPGLYSDDLASDVRGLVKSLLRLPFDEDRIVEILQQQTSTVANNPDDEDYTIFWLALADQFEKRGVSHAPTREKALDIIASGKDLAMLEKRGMKASDLRKRARTLEELRARLLAAPTVSRPRTTLRAPLPYVLETGVLHACPTKGSECINPYIGRKNLDGTPWVHDSYRQFIIVACGKAFGFLPWYQPIVTIKTVPEKPRLDDVESELWWKLDSPKTCSEKHFKIMEVEALGGVAIDLEKLRGRFPKRPRGVYSRGVYFGLDGTSAAVIGVTIGDSMAPSAHDWEKWYVPRALLPEEGPTIMRSLTEILASDPD